MPFCYKCGAQLSEGANFCKSCGARQDNRDPAIATNSSTLQATSNTVNVKAQGKSMTIVLLLALLPGFFGFWGIGHFYIGKTTRGVVFLICGLFLDDISVVVIAISLGVATPIIVWFPLIGWLVESWDAYKRAKAMGIR
jgi:hypothetical protein